MLYQSRRFAWDRWPKPGCWQMLSEAVPSSPMALHCRPKLQQHAPRSHLHGKAERQSILRLWLKQAPRCWWEKLATVVTGLGFEPAVNNPCIYVNFVIHPIHSI